MKNKLKQELFIFLVFGMIYFTLEGIFRFMSYSPMILIGGLCGICIDLLFGNERMYQLKMWQICIIGLIIIWTIEYASGYFLAQFGLELWKYTKFGNINGYISIPFGLIVFTPLIPFCIWLGDYLRYKFFGKREIYPLTENYKELFTGK